MPEELTIPNVSLDEWLNVLKPYQRKIKNLADGENYEISIERWLSANGPQNTVKFGGLNDSNPFYENFKNEIAKFLCGHPDYDEARKKLFSESKVTEVVLINIISTAIAATLGILASLLVPAVAIVLYIVGKASLKAWCVNNYKS